MAKKDMVEIERHKLRRIVELAFDITETPKRSMAIKYAKGIIDILQVRYWTVEDADGKIHYRRVK